MFWRGGTHIDIGGGTKDSYTEDNIILWYIRSLIKSIISGKDNEKEIMIGKGGGTILMSKIGALIMLS